MVTGKGGPGQDLQLEQVTEIIELGFSEEALAGKKALVLTPDATRTCPLPRMIRSLQAVLGKRVGRLDYMVALGSHKPLSDKEILSLYGITEERRAAEFSDSRFLNHRWDEPGALVKLGSISAGEIKRLTKGLFSEAVDVVINRAIYDYDLLMILGPVFPHEVVGFSGGNKYLFPGISGGEFLHFFHWLAAVITCWKTIGFKQTPVREVLDQAASMVPVPRHCLSMVVGPGNTLAGLYVGSPEEAWSQAADLSSQLHIIYKNRTYDLVVGSAPAMYDELWVGGKVMYKLEPVVAAGGKLIIYGPHIRSISHTWGTHLTRIGYHVRDFFLKQMDRYKDIPRGVLAHSSHVKGLGTYEGGVEKPRIEVVLATSIPEETCRRINLGFMDHSAIRLDEYQGREDEGVLFVDHAGEVLHRCEGTLQS